ncbi:MAG: DNA-directed RNA polymerase subunit H, partial [archaeon]
MAAAKKKEKETPKPKAKQIEHELVPKHELIKEEEIEKLLKEYGIQKTHLPKIQKTDPALAGIDAGRGDVVKIIRKSPTAIT